MSYLTIVYYCLRISTLLATDQSHVFVRDTSFDYNDINFALFIIFSFNLAMIMGFLLVSEKPMPEFKYDNKKFDNFMSLILLFTSALLLLHVSGAWDSLLSHSRLGRSLLSLINLHWFIYIALVIYLPKVIYAYRPHWYHTYSLASIIIIYNIFLIFNGSRGYHVFFIELVALALLSINKSSIKKKNLYLLLGISAVALIGSFNIYSIANNARNFIAAPKFDISIDYVSPAKYGENTRVISHALARIGYLDVTSEIISNKDMYEPIFTLKNYYKSFVDNVFTPGIDFFDTPKITNSLYFKHQYIGNGIPSKSFALDNDIINSDILTIYGEFYSIFGFLALPILFGFAFIMKFAYYYEVKSNNFDMIVFKRIGILVLFYAVFNSFGLDWIAIVRIIPIVATIFLITKYYKYFYKT